MEILSTPGVGSLLNRQRFGEQAALLILVTKINLSVEKKSSLTYVRSSQESKRVLRNYRR